MAAVTVYSDHQRILDDLITSGNVGAMAAAVKTGPFETMREAYLFAVSIAVAHGNVTPEEEMPDKAGARTIAGDVFLRAEGAAELADVVVFASGNREDAMSDDELRRRVGLIARRSMDLDPEVAGLLDRYAHAGFSWLAEHREDEGSVRDLILTALEQIDLVENEDDGDDPPVENDPLLDMLL